MKSIALLTASILLLGGVCNDICEEEHSLWPAYEPGKRCVLHNAKLVSDIVPLSWGHVVYQLDYLEGLEKSFPNARTIYQLGCGYPGVDRARVGYCPECRRAYTAWLALKASDIPDKSGVD